MPTRISALALVVPDDDQALAFHVGTLGFGLTEDIDQGRKRWVTVEPPPGGVRLELAQAEGSAQASATGNEAGGRMFPVLETDDFARDHAALLAGGVTFEAPPPQTLWHGCGLARPVRQPLGRPGARRVVTRRATTPCRPGHRRFRRPTDDVPTLTGPGRRPDACANPGSGASCGGRSFRPRPALTAGRRSGSPRVTSWLIRRVLADCCAPGRSGLTD
jgi:hypothetical protein